MPENTTPSEALFFIGTRIGSGSGNTPGTRRAQKVKGKRIGTARAPRIGNTPKSGTKRIQGLAGEQLAARTLPASAFYALASPGSTHGRACTLEERRRGCRKERSAAGKNCAPTSSAVDAQSKHPPPALLKNDNREHRWKTKIRSLHSPTPGARIALWWG
jgi:hypothetical protein